eukprot:758495-Hanusia_phi.AAC.1
MSITTCLASTSSFSSPPSFPSPPLPFVSPPSIFLAACKLPAEGMMGRQEGAEQAGGGAAGDLERVRASFRWSRRRRSMDLSLSLVTLSCSIVREGEGRRGTTTNHHVQRLVLPPHPCARRLQRSLETMRSSRGRRERRAGRAGRLTIAWRNQKHQRERDREKEQGEGEGAGRGSRERERERERERKDRGSGSERGGREGGRVTGRANGWTLRSVRPAVGCDPDDSRTGGGGGRGRRRKRRRRGRPEDD